MTITAYTYDTDYTKNSLLDYNLTNFIKIKI